MDVKPRKFPRQARAKATVDAIIEATIQVLLEHGYDRFTTTRAAERAGVSVGTLYQYFPNKAALASAVIDRCCDDFLTALDDIVAARPQQTLHDCLRALVDRLLISHHLAPDLHRIVIELAPRIGVAQKTELVSRKAAEAIEAMLRRHADELPPDTDIAAAATVIQTALEALAHRSVLAHPAHLPDDTLAREAMRLITTYLNVHEP